MCIYFTFVHEVEGSTVPFRLSLNVRQFLVGKYRLHNTFEFRKKQRFIYEVYNTLASRMRMV